ncbi:MAG TPA: hypothetical protein VJ813_09905 [Vicinamibacterales bacterium]|nr:hypothetical protein [Vicinamibacterales bacterium]
MSLGTAALADPARSAGAEQFTQNCQTSNPRLERLASAIERGDLHYVRSALDEGLDVNETWRDVPAQICRSVLLRTVWHGRDDIFNLLLKRGADPRTISDDALGIPVRTGRLDMTRTLLGLGLRLPNKFEIVLAAIESGNMAMFDLVASSGVTIDASTVPAWALTDALTLHLVPRYFRPNDTLPNVGNEACTVQELFGLLSAEQDGCEGTVGPLWLHFVVTGNIRMMELMIKNGADLSLSSGVWDNSTTRPFNAMDVAIRRKDKRMADLLRRAGAPAGIWGRKPVRIPVAGHQRSNLWAPGTAAKTSLNRFSSPGSAGARKPLGHARGATFALAMESRHAVASPTSVRRSVSPRAPRERPRRIPT